tara:strand:+ start:3586 stop:4902 length:1317 start_codon:yes stop_codon:yes gene_type:complete
MPIQNQGHRRDLNLSDSPNKRDALDNLGGIGISDDLFTFRNNLRNTSTIPFSKLNSSDNEFTFNEIKEISITQISSSENVTSPGNFTVNVTVSVPYDIPTGNRVSIEGVTPLDGSSPDSAFNKMFNSNFIISSVGSGGTSFSYNVDFTNSGLTGTEESLSSGTVKYNPIVDFIYTNDDVVGVSKTVSVGSTSLFPNTDYYVCNSDTLTKFKLSYFPSDVGISTIPITISNSASEALSFKFVRKEPVTKQSLINFIRPEIQDTELFRFFSRPSAGTETDEGGARRDNVVEAFEECDQNTQLSQLLLQDKFRGDQDTTVIDELFIEGFLKLNDPAGENTSANVVLNNSDSPGIYIGGTRAFSSDNNPWTESVATGTNGELITQSDEVTINTLIFDGKIEINGLAADDLNNISPAESLEFDSTVPIVIDGETFALLLKTKS